MTDIFDLASEREQKDRDLAIKRQLEASAVSARKIKAQGYCLACFEDFAANDNQRLYCNAKCATDHSRRVAAGNK